MSWVKDFLSSLAFKPFWIFFFTFLQFWFDRRINVWDTEAYVCIAADEREKVKRKQIETQKDTKMCDKKVTKTSKSLADFIISHIMFILSRWLKIA